MHYVSTRGEAPSASFLSILLEGLAPDGGLYVPEVWPSITHKELLSFKSQPYHVVAARILSKFVSEIPESDLLSLTAAAYTPASFCHTRDGSDPNKIFPVRKLDDGMFLLELSNGPTLAFKDAAMQLLGHLLDWALAREDKHLTILGATSGDTGSAAIHALRGKKRVRVVMLSPAGRMSDFQRAQMYSVLDDNILNIAIRGTFDDCQDLVKELNTDAPFKTNHRLGAVNSINWARVIAQSVYYIWAYLQIAKNIGDPVSFCVPSGNFGNVFAGFAAKKMGLPIDRLVVATNENDVLYRVFENGFYRPNKTALETSSPSMDITKASNFERAVFEAADKNGKLVAEMWEKLQTKGEINFSHDYPHVWSHLLEMDFDATTSTHHDRLRLIRQAHEDWGLFIDPHTADGLKGAFDLRKASETMVVLETAQAAKFESTIIEALGQSPSKPASFDNLLSLPQRFTDLDNDASQLKAQIELFAQTK